MDYGTLGKSAVPHVSTLGQHFEISYLDYMYSLIIEASFLILILPLTGIWIYFSAKYKKPKKRNNEDDNGNQIDQEQQAKKEATINGSQADAKSQMMEDEVIRGSRKKTMQQQYTLQQAGKTNDEATKKKLELVERKICYGICFFILHVVAVNNLDSGILSIVTFYLTIFSYALFNIVRPIKHIFIQSIYILPAFTSAFAFWVGDHKFGTHKP